ncbi:TetR/AcrR family transcriptional regulator [Psychrobacillus sp. OK032]|uniref:TetR/AcrR family transcriptional regulator n=1 Tax=Psychrobacillus sp. OK032 TaxID=1884358 RepID=UPI0008AFFE2E|nr:TetR/AcrR family transcriptional regulator [Psychrobacillus sp. OK032]SES35818.1 transcriptional regulator, TetR family [Psychrobacillus sp. OK032]
MTIPNSDKRVLRTKQDLRTSILTLMEQKPFADIFIKEIVETAQYNRGTFYAHYDSKEQLLDEIINVLFEDMEIAYRHPYVQLSVIELDKIASESVVLFEHFLSNKRLYQLLLSPATNYNFHKKLTEKIDQLFREDFIISKEIDPSVDLNLFNTYRIYGVVGLIVEWIENDFLQPPSYMSDQLLRILKFSTPEVNVNQQR